MKTRTLLLLTMVLSLSFPLFPQEDGRIIYTDFEPDTIISPIVYYYDGGDSIDVNRDSEWDLYFNKQYYSPGPTSFNMYACNNWEICAIMHDSISVHTHWIWDNTFMDVYFNQDTIINLGLRYSINDVEYCYGWIRLSYDRLSGDAFSITIYDMAYCTIPNYPLRFGQTSFTDVDENGYELPEAMLFPNPADDKLSLRISGDISCDNVMIYGIDGRLLKMQNDDFENIDVSDMSGGIYITKITLDNGITYTDKIVIK
ncbi:MAG: T9SS type A sorting domain-containing protein [Bacteroidales bacterium]|nr:T9SS type A sorting domain-containing protein [Bacteroidales bacterium]